MLLATIDRFRDIMKKGCLPKEMGGHALTAQAKYDFLAALNTMDQIQNLTVAIEKRENKRESFRERVVASALTALNKMFADKEKNYTAQDIDGAIKLLTDCRTELLMLEGEEKSDRALKKLISDGITAK